MATSFPSGLDVFTNPTTTDNLNTATVYHDEQHANVNDAVEALEAKVGINSSAVPTSLDYKVSQAVTKTATQASETANIDILNYETAHASRGPFRFHVAGSGPFNGDYDPVLSLGYNNSIGGGRELAGEPAFFFAIEAHYDDTTKELIEAYWTHVHTNGDIKRPIFFQVNKATGAAAGFNIRSNGISFTSWDSATEFVTMSLAHGASPGLFVNGMTGQTSDTQLVVGAQNSKRAVLTLAGGLTMQSFAADWWQFLIGGSTILEFQQTKVDIGGGQVFLGTLSVQTPTARKDTDHSVVIKKIAAQTTKLLRITDESNNPYIAVEPSGAITLTDVNVALSATTGTRFGTATTQKLAFYNATPVAQPAGIANPSGGAVVDAEARTAINAILANLEALGLQAVA